MYLEDCHQGVPAEPTNRVSGYSPHIADAAQAFTLWDVSAKLLAQVKCDECGYSRHIY